MRKTHKVVGDHAVSAPRYTSGYGGVRGSPEPDLHEVVCTFHSVPSTTIGVERWPVTVRVRRMDSTTLIAVVYRYRTAKQSSVPMLRLMRDNELTGSVAVRADLGTSLRDPRGRHCAPRSGMERRLIRTDVVDTLDDVDFAIIRPDRTKLPNSRPGTTALRHVLDVETERLS